MKNFATTNANANATVPVLVSSVGNVSIGNACAPTINATILCRPRPAARP